jgi:hypothetical protein
MHWSQLLDVTKGRYSGLPAVPPIAAAISTTATATTAATTAAAAATTTAATAAGTTAATAAAATTTTAAAASLRTLFGFIHAQRASVDHLAVHAFDGALGLLVRTHRHEREAAGLPRRAIRHDVHIRHFTVLRERRANRFGIRMK